MSVLVVAVPDYRAKSVRAKLPSFNLSYFLIVALAILFMRE